jgi:hypothetical protein
MTGADLPIELIVRAQMTQARCAKLAVEFSIRASRKQRIQTAITALSNGIGIVSLVATFYLPGIAWGGTELGRAVTMLSAIALIIVPYLQMAVYRDPPTRHQDYAFYIGGYAHKIEEILADVKSVRRYERLMEVLALADKNLNDVRVKWPAIMSKVEAELKGDDLRPN